MYAIDHLITSSLLLLLFAWIGKYEEKKTVVT